MQLFIKAGEIQRKQVSRTLLHVQLEVTILLLLKVAEDATKELTSLTRSIVTGQLDSEILSCFYDGALIAISEKDTIPVLSFAVSLLEPTKKNCTQINDNYLCAQPSDDFVWAAKTKLGQPAITHTSVFYSKIQDALSADVNIDFPNCLKKEIGTNLK